MQAEDRLHRADEFWLLPHADRRRELVRGRIVEFPLNDYRHGIVAAWIGSLIAGHVDDHDLGSVATLAGYILTTDPDTVRGPDISFISHERRQPLSGYYLLAAPDLAVEVISRDDTASAIHDMVRDFLEAGTKAVWVLYPSSQTIAVHMGEGSRTLAGDDVLDGGDALPGFRVKVSEVFKKLRD